MVHTVSFLPRSTLKLHQNARLWVPSLGGKGADALRLEICIAGEVFHTFIECIMTFGGDSGIFFEAPYGPHRVISAKVDSQIAYKMQDVGYPVFTDNGMMCCKEEYPLLLKYFKPSLALCCI